MKRVRDRRRQDAPVRLERRQSDRRKLCPQCASPLLSDTHQENGFRQTTQVCTSSICSFTSVNRTVPMGKISLAPQYPLKVERSGRRLMLELPLELCHFAKLEPNQSLTLKTRSAGYWIIEKD